MGQLVRWWWKVWLLGCYLIRNVLKVKEMLIFFGDKRVWKFETGNNARMMMMTSDVVVVEQEAI